MTESPYDLLREFVELWYHWNEREAPDDEERALMVRARDLLAQPEMGERVWRVEWRDRNGRVMERRYTGLEERARRWAQLENEFPLVIESARIGEWEVEE